jgi:hypothetical protein
VEKVAQKCGLLLYVIFIKLAKVNNHPLGENPPNLAVIDHATKAAILF